MSTQLNWPAYLEAGQTTISNFLLQHYRDLGISNDEFLVLLHIKASIDHGEPEPSTQLISEAIGWSRETVYGHLESLKNKGLANFINQRDSRGMVVTRIDFAPLYTKLMTSHLSSNGKITTTSDSKTYISEAGKARADIYSLIESEFGRPLSQMEIKVVTDWFDEDHFKIELIQAAIQEAVMNGALNLKYIEAILVSWQKKNYQSIQQVQSERQKRNQFKQLHTDEKVDIPDNIDILNTDWSSFK